MNTEVLEKRFAEMGARVRISERTPRAANARHRAFALNGPRFSQAPVALNVLSDKKGEYFTIVGDPGIDVSVVNIAPKDRHLLLVANQDGDKSKFLCGHDERHWFVAAVPESAANVTTVAKAKEALRPDSLQDVSKRLRKKDRYSRRNSAYKRQGEFFFVPTKEDLSKLPVLYNEPLSRGRGKPHVVQFVVRRGGSLVYTSGSRVLSASEFEQLSRVDRKRPWVARMRDSQVFAKGKVKHSDHATVVLDDWHEVFLNTEQGAQAMRSVMFLD